MTWADIANGIYGYFFVAAATGVGLWRLFQHGVHKSVENHLNELREELKPLMELMSEMDKRTTRIEYALYNDGKTGLINKVEELLVNQQSIKVDVEVMKVKAEA
jgi:hypothetical protein